MKWVLVRVLRGELLSLDRLLLPVSTASKCPGLQNAEPSSISSHVERYAHTLSSLVSQPSHFRLIRPKLTPAVGALDRSAICSLPRSATSNGRCGSAREAQRASRSSKYTTILVRYHPHTDLDLSIA